MQEKLSKDEQGVWNFALRSFPGDFLLYIQRARSVRAGLPQRRRETGRSADQLVRSSRGERLAIGPAAGRSRRSPLVLVHSRRYREPRAGPDDKDFLFRASETHKTLHTNKDRRLYVVTPGGAHRRMIWRSYSSEFLPLRFEQRSCAV
jgi:hypothetical protein